ncbi:MAG: hypothetical protein NVS4B8_16210 [Herpetosiphon sp.]
MFHNRLVAAVLLIGLAACGKPTEQATGGRAESKTPVAAVPSQPARATIATKATGNPEGAAGTGTTATGGAAAGSKRYTAAPTMQIDPNKTYTAVIDTTKGKMTAELFAKEDPLTVNNFVFLARDGFYRNIKFHRIIKGFMVQTGDPQGTGAGGPGYSFKDEPVKREYTRGTLAMANAGPNTNGSQFFIVDKDTGLPKNYTIFGKLTDGLDVLTAISNTPVAASGSGEASKPTEDVLIKDVTITEK